MRQIGPAFLGWGAVAVAAALRPGLFVATPTDAMLTPDSSAYLGMADRFPSGYLIGHISELRKPSRVSTVLGSRPGRRPG